MHDLFISILYRLRTCGCYNEQRHSGLFVSFLHCPPSFDLVCASSEALAGEAAEAREPDPPGGMLPDSFEQCGGGGAYVFVLVPETEADMEEACLGEWGMA